MSHVLCAVDDRLASAEAVQAAIDLCRERGADLTLVGVVRPLAGVAQPAHGELVRRQDDVQERLIEAIRAAQAAGITPSAVYRAGDAREEVLLEAASSGASDVFFTTTQGRLASAFAHDGRATVTHLALEGVVDAEAALHLAA